MDTRIAHLLEHPSFRQGITRHDTSLLTQSSGYPELDAWLPGGGWPRGQLTEILIDREAVGELSLLMPALAALSHERRWIAWIAPPHIPYAPALAAWGINLTTMLLVTKRGMDRLWAAEQALASGMCGAVLTWPGIVDFRQLRRLQLAAERGRTCGFLFRPRRAAAEASPATLRLSIAREEGELIVHNLKGWHGSTGVSSLRLRPDHAVAGRGAA